MNRLDKEESVVRDRYLWSAVVFKADRTYQRLNNLSWIESPKLKITFVKFKFSFFSRK